MSFPSPKNRFHQSLRAIVASLVLLTSTSCLKTRAQLREEQEEQRQAVPQQVQDVQPQGQYALEELKSEILRLTGKVDELERNHQSASKKEDLGKDDLKKLETRMAELEQAQAQLIEAVKKLQVTAAPPADPDLLYQKGRTEFLNQQWDPAIESLTQYLKTPQPKHEEDALFLRGSAYFKKPDYKKAIVDYSRFPEKFNQSSRMPVALLRIAESFELMGMKDDALTFYQELAEKFPKTAEGKKAKLKLKPKSKKQ